VDLQSAQVLAALSAAVKEQPCSVAFLSDFSGAIFCNALPWALAAASIPVLVWLIISSVYDSVATRKATPKYHSISLKNESG
jgi:hypothetical protein